ncbi:OmpA family protein [Flavobacterium succinicans]|uniref:Photosystem I P700 chlorophyll a apoprotein A2 n=1 Tax=Flavobacterium succinicans TaxID=29536 RepID=A0A199XUU9_9FLAO|nr:OmpA family protein [Flavobacterium succinicans]OAZ05548.1 photosystem I P700 chlorophyll a apoprotein A2 [Flavobacterium succinicans]
MKNIYIILIVLVYQFAIGQQQELQRANILFTKTYYSAAIPLFEEISKKRPTNEVIQKLGDCYYYTNQYDKAESQYALLSKNNALTEEFYFKHAQTLKAIGKYADATSLLRQYYTNANDAVAIVKLDEGIKQLKNVTALGERFVIKNLALNTMNSEFGGVVWNDNFVFAAVKLKPNLFDKTYKWNNESYLNLVSIPLADVNSKEALVNYFSKDLKSALHESNAVFTKDGKTMYFTRNNSKNGKRVKNSAKVSNIQIFRADFVNNKWTNIQSLPFNSPEYSVEHPALSPDNKTLYFASDMPGTLGSLDIFSVTIEGTTYGKPVNLGRQINTAKREQFPFVSNDNKLYFSSNGHEGYGGLDIFVSDLSASLLKASNVGLPVNSGYDDFAFYINSDSKEGYFSSDRPGGKGKDDIYSFKETKELLIENCKQYIAGTITDKDSHLVLENALVILKNADKNELERVTTSLDGKFSFTIECESKYSIEVTKENYTENSRNLSSTAERNKSNDGSMTIRSLEAIKKEQQLMIDQKKANDLLIAQQLKAAELVALAKKKKEEAIALENKKKEDLAALSQLKKDKELADKEATKLAIAKKKEKMAAIIAAEKDVVKEKDRLMIKTDPIYFDYTMWYIRKESKKILNRVVELMKKYPEMVVEIGSHTDNRGNQIFNAELSQKRADATKAYIIEQGISKNRITAKGYGESVPIVKCIPEDSCDEEQHELNRRSEFVIKNL